MIKQELILMALAMAGGLWVTGVQAAQTGFF